MSPYKSEKNINPISKEQSFFSVQFCFPTIQKLKELTIEDLCSPILFEGHEGGKLVHVQCPALIRQFSAIHSANLNTDQIK